MNAKSRLCVLVLSLAVVTLNVLHWGLPTKPPAETTPAEITAPKDTAEEAQNETRPLEGAPRFDYLENPPPYAPESPPYPFARELADMQREAAEKEQRREEK